MACWTGAREEDSGGFWPSHAAVAAQGQADASEVTAMRALGWRQKPAGHSSKEQLCWGTLDPWLLLHAGFPLAVVGRCRSREQTGE